MQPRWWTCPRLQRAVWSGMRHTSPRALALALAVLATGCPGKPETEEELRKRETVAIEGRVDSWKVTLYRALKTSVRALPPRDHVQRLTAGKKTLTREEWIALLESDPSLASYKNRAGFFVVGSQLREAGYASALTAVALLAAKGGGHLAGPSDPVLELPSTPHPFGSSVVFYGECKDLIGDDEDRYPTITIAMLPGDLAKAARERTGPFATSPLDRLAVNALEHTILGCAWLTVEPTLALYELTRARADELLPAEEAVLRVARAGLFVNERFPYHALDELAEIEKKKDEIGKALARLPREGEEMSDPAGTVAGLVHLGRVEIYSSMGKKDEATKELALAEASMKGSEHLRVALHLFAAKAHVDRNEFKKAADELRTAADALKTDAKKNEELRALAERIEKELPDSFGPVDLARWVVRILEADVRKRVVPAASTQLGEAFRDTSKKSVEELEKAFPSQEDVKAKALEGWKRLRASVADTRSSSR